MNQHRDRSGEKTKYDNAFSRILNSITPWLALFRLPFHTVGILPFVLGSLLARTQMGIFRWDIFGLGTFGVILIMLATYAAGEYWDVIEDTLTARTGEKRRFSGGSQVIQRGLLSRRTALHLSWVSLLLAATVGCLLQFAYRTGPWTIPLGALGSLGGFFYSTPPIRWVSTGLGELWIALCYGWLPIAVGYYLQTERIAPLVHQLAIPIGLSIFNVILLNEFPDVEADRCAGKKNLTVRLGRKRAVSLYVLASVAAWSGVALSLCRGVPLRALYVYLPVLVASLTVVVSLFRGLWQNHQSLEWLLAGSLAVNLGTTAAYLVAFAG